MRDASDIEQALSVHGTTVWRVCVLYFRSSPDAQDAYQETFLKYALADSAKFSDKEHKKAWLIRVATNVCKDMLKAAHRKNEPLDEGSAEERLVSADTSTQPSSFEKEVVEAIRSLDDPPRTPLYLALYEGYTAPEISDMLDAPVNTVYSWVARGKALLKEALA